RSGNQGHFDPPLIGPVVPIVLFHVEQGRARSHRESCRRLRRLLFHVEQRTWLKRAGVVRLTKGPSRDDKDVERMSELKKQQARPSRLGRGLSSLMTAPVSVQPPAQEPAAPAIT